MIKRLSEAMSLALVSNNFLHTSSKISFHMNKKSVVTAQNLQSTKIFLTLED